MDKGEWSIEDYKFEIKNTQNKIERERIFIQKQEIEKKEINLKIADLDLNIAKANDRQKQLKLSLHWLEQKLKE